MGDDEYEDKTVIAEMDHLIQESHKQTEASHACLVQYNGNDLGKRYALDGSVMTVGRSAEASLCIAENSVSRIHARMHRNENLVEIEDAASANGTYINDKKIEQGRIALRDGDMIRLGTVMLKFFAADNIDGFVQDKIYRMATVDVGTQIYNKQYLMAALSREFKLSQNHSRTLSLIYFDLDHFKKVNDTYGHNAGDQILREGAALAKGCVRKDDILARFGGEEFIIILPNTDLSDAVNLAEKVRKSFETYKFLIEYEKDTQKLKVDHKQTISLGVSQLGSGMESIKEFLESADKKLYSSKQNGRNRVTS